MDDAKMNVDSDDGDIIINEADGLPSFHPNLELDLSQTKRNTAQTFEEMVNDEDLPTSLIVTNLDNTLFQNESLKREVEQMFAQFGEPESFQYFRSFRRMRVNYKSPASAAKARIQLHQTRFGDTIINCYFAQPVTPIDSADRHLQPPAPVKQFLISPPSSPPIGWEPREEGEPLINYDLLAAIANLTPGGKHELHAPSETQPGIVVHVCEDAYAGAKPRIVQTRCPTNQN